MDTPNIPPHELIISIIAATSALMGSFVIPYTEGKEGKYRTIISKLQKAYAHNDEPSWEINIERAILEIEKEQILKEIETYICEAKKSGHQHDISRLVTAIFSLILSGTGAFGSQDDPTNFIAQAPALISASTNYINRSTNLKLCDDIETINKLTMYASFLAFAPFNIYMSSDADSILRIIGTTQVSTAYLLKYKSTDVKDENEVAFASQLLLLGYFLFTLGSGYDIYQGDHILDKPMSIAGGAHYSILLVLNLFSYKNKKGALPFQVSELQKGRSFFQDLILKKSIEAHEMVKKCGSKILKSLPH